MHSASQRPLPACLQLRSAVFCPAGDKYEGEWKEGRENGVGTSIAADGSTFYGFWLDGHMHGEGVRAWQSFHILISLQAC